MYHTVLYISLSLSTPHNRFGPLVQHWTMRYEARHCYFKRLAQNLDETCMWKTEFWFLCTSLFTQSLGQGPDYGDFNEKWKYNVEPHSTKQLAAWRLPVSFEGSASPSQHGFEPDLHCIL